MKTRVLTTLAELDDLAADWESLERTAITPRQEFIWVRECASRFRGQGELRIVVAEEGDRLVAAIPLCLRKRSSSLEFLGVQGEVFETNGPLASDGESLAALSTAIRDLGFPLLLQNVGIDSGLPQSLSAAFHGRGFCVIRPAGEWPLITLNSTWAEPESKFNSKRRAYLRRARRIAEEIGTVDYQVLTPTPATLPAMLRDAYSVEAASWKGETRTALALDESLGGLYRAYATAACTKGRLRLCFLRIGGKAAAMQIAIESNDRFWLMKIGYDEAFASCSPGNLLIRESVSYAARQGLKSIGFLGAPEPWKLQWSREMVRSVTLHAYPWGMRGLATLAKEATRHVIDKLRRRALCRTAS